MDVKHLNPLIAQYLDFQNQSQTPFHAVQKIQKDLLDFSVPLSLKDPWKLKPSASYHVVHPDGKSVVAFRVPESALEDVGFHLAAAHTDSPVLRLRLNPWELAGGSMGRLLTQVHGGLIYRSYFDRPLMLSGVVYRTVRKNKKIQLAPKSNRPLVERVLVSSHIPIGVIPEVAYHLDRSKNDSGAINPEQALSCIFGTTNTLDELKQSLMAHLGFDGQPDGFELTLSPYFPHQIVGVDHSLIVGPRHDDLAMVFTILQAFCEAVKDTKKQNNPCPVIAFFDAEETGSETSSGAGSYFLRHVLERVAEAHPKRTKSAHISQAFANSFVISGDMAHGWHPSFSDKHDVNHRPHLNKGIVLKENANDRYATSGETGTILRALCERAEVPVQNFVIRQDLTCGSTVGPILAAKLSCATVDIGIPMWGMHSTGETMGTKDLVYAASLFREFF